MKKVILIFVYVLLTSPLFAETIILKSGKKIEGKIIEKTNEYIKIDFYGVPLTYYSEDIARIETKGLPQVLYRAKGKQEIQPQKDNSFISNNKTENTSFPIFAITNNDVTAVRKAIENGADVNARDHNGHTALLSAVGHNSLDVAKLLIENGADVNLGDYEDDTPLISAAGQNSLDVAKLLIENGADVNAKDSRGLTALMYAAFNNSLAVAKLLIANSANVNAKDKDGGTALRGAAQYNCLEVAKLLIENGADVNAKTTDGQTVLHWAIVPDEIKLYGGALASGHSSLEIVELLIKNGANVNATGHDGKTVLESAIEINASAAQRGFSFKQDYSEIIGLLKKHGAK